MSDFTWTPSYQTEVTDEYAVTRAEFGDGYVQQAANGINPVREIWRLVFTNIPLTTGEQIRAFLRGKVGQSFTWTNPSELEKRYTLRGPVSMPRNGPAHVNLTCEFEEWFGS